ncbi:MAG: 9-O-acetylesterase [Gemmatimonadetes bacterium]|nr:9-O-acetylesterase [Gemmatimonadota bacterium]
MSDSRGPATRALVAGMLLLAAGARPAAGQCPESAPGLCLARIFQDGMVLQRDRPVPVWGWAPPGARVRVRLNGATRQDTASLGGAWAVRFPPLAAGGPYTLAVEAGDRQVRVRDVLAGDVWVASGQSNMEWPLARDADADVAVPAANDPQLREFAVPHTWSAQPEADLAGGRWAPADPAHAGQFSAVAYYFARELRSALGVPIGIIHTSWGGANIETWMSPRALGLSDSAYQAAIGRERGRQDSIALALSARLGQVPERDPGLVDGKAVWADPALADALWLTLPVPSLWEDAGLPGLDGGAWYRTAFTLSGTEAASGARLSLGTIDDDDITWVNGSEVGRTMGYAEPRRYQVPATVLRPGRNVLAVRVTDGAGGGGLYGSPDSLYLEIGGKRRPLAGQWQFRVGEVSLQPDGQRINKVPAALYNRMLHPLLRFPIEGVIWYQGESNANNDAQASAYRQQFAGLIESWRREWAEAGGGGTPRDFPFLWVQLPNYGPVDTVPPTRASWALLRESQSAALALPATAQVVAIDLGNPGDIHPRNKLPVGQRLALAARRTAYGEDVIASGPVYRAHTVSSGRITVSFDTGGSGMTVRPGDRSLQGFAIAGADRRWVWAEARLYGDRVTVWSPQVPEPVAVRYAWGNSPRTPSLTNRDGLPAAQFRTDDWE